MQRGDIVFAFNVQVVLYKKPAVHSNARRAYTWNVNDAVRALRAFR